MIGYWLLKDQFMVPYFAVSTLLIVGLELAAYTLLKALRIGSPQYRSVLLAIPLASPLAVYLWFPPHTRMTRYYLMNLSQGAAAGPGSALKRVLIPSALGFLCLAGLAVGVLTYVLLYSKGPGLIVRLLNVLEVPWDEHPGLGIAARRMADEAGVRLPRLGIIECIEPNAFTVGYGDSCYLVMTSGLLEVLDARALEAVVAHEIGHIKNRDHHFSAAVSALRLVSFFNPLVHVVCSAAFREREYMADEVGSALIGGPYDLGKALVDIWENGSQEVAKLPMRLMFSVLGVSSINQSQRIMSLHPPIESRLRNLSVCRGRDGLSRDAPKTALALILTGTVLLAFGLPTLTYAGLLCEPRRMFLRYSEEPTIQYVVLSDSVVLIKNLSNENQHYMNFGGNLMLIRDPALVRLIETYLVETNVLYAASRDTRIVFGSTAQGEAPPVATSDAVVYVKIEKLSAPPG
jgi:Zn-dependent protease with chaperone function